MIWMKWHNNVLIPVQQLGNLSFKQLPFQHLFKGPFQVISIHIIDSWACYEWSLRESFVKTQNLSHYYPFNLLPTWTPSNNEEQKLKGIYLYCTKNSEREQSRDFTNNWVLMMVLKGSTDYQSWSHFNYRERESKE